MSSIPKMRSPPSAFERAHTSFKKFVTTTIVLGRELSLEI
jgi:hypothetical protein